MWQFMYGSMILAWDSPLDCQWYPFGTLIRSMLMRFRQWSLVFFHISGVVEFYLYMCVSYFRWVHIHSRGFTSASKKVMFFLRLSVCLFVNHRKLSIRYILSRTGNKRTDIDEHMISFIFMLVGIGYVVLWRYAFYGVLVYLPVKCQMKQNIINVTRYQNILLISFWAKPTYIEITADILISYIWYV